MATDSTVKRGTATTRALMTRAERIANDLHGGRATPEQIAAVAKILATKTTRDTTR
jgi:acyl-CoA hydrolase